MEFESGIRGSMFGLDANVFGLALLSTYQRETETTLISSISNWPAIIFANSGIQLKSNCVTGTARRLPF